MPKSRRRASSRSRSRSRSRYTKRRTYRASSAGRKSRRAPSRSITAFRTTVQQGITPFGQSYFARLRFVEDFAISAAAVTTPPSVSLGGAFRLNSIFDPSTVTTGQPYYFDQLTLFYSVYQVHSVSITATFYNPLQDGFWVGLRVRNSGELSTLGMDLDQLRAFPRTVMKQINDTGVQKVTIKINIPIWEVFGLTKARYLNESNTESSVTGNPSYTLIPWLETFCCNTMGTPSAIRCSVNCLFNVMFKAPITIPTSSA